MAKKKVVSVHEYEQERKRVQKTARLRWARMRKGWTTVTLINDNDPDSRPCLENPKIKMSFAMRSILPYGGIADDIKEMIKDSNTLTEFLKKYEGDAKNFKYNGYVFDDE